MKIGRVLLSAALAVGVAIPTGACGRSQLFTVGAGPADGGPQVDGGQIPCGDDPRGFAGDPCTLENDFGACPGSFVCEEDALICRASQIARAEECNGVDDDCDGLEDEDFQDEDGRLTQVEHCGACNNDCADVFPNALAVACDAAVDAPQCVIAECPPGFVLVDDALCVPQQRLLCLACADDTDCAASPGARCLPVEDENGNTVMVCAQDCSAGSAFGACPAGFSCLDDPAGPVPFSDQCLPVGGTCSCATLPDGASFACTVIGSGELTGEPIVCNGERTCFGGQAGECVLPLEVCDGVDQDCNGRIDDPFRDPVTGLYDQDPSHCGFCGNDCTATFFPNATSGCIGGDEGVPRCGPTCLPGFFDIDEDESNGCECQLLGRVDFPDPDGIDANCDGIDGEVERSVFVAPTGSDSNPGTIDQPMRTISAGLARARALGRRDVLVAQGVYSQNVTLENGVSLYGGYSQDFTERDFERLETVIFGQPLQGTERGAVTGDDISNDTTFDGFSVFGIDAATLGESTYAISVVDSTAALRISNNRVIGGSGAPGSAGERGSDGDDGVDATGGADGVSTNRECTLEPLAGGTGGSQSCEGTSVSGGDGGESHCPITEQLDGTRPCNGAAADQCKNTFDGTGTPPPAPPPQGAGGDGDNGGAAGGDPTYDRWTNSNLCFLCGLQSGWPHIGEAGADGAGGVDGSAGIGCFDARGVATATAWFGLGGSPGDSGTHGGGAGGGSAGSGFDVTPGAASGNCSDRLGASGGGGGSGACRGTRGTGGSAGGGSFGIWVGFSRAAAAPPVVRDNVIEVGSGGPGGSGGVAGSGGLGGLGGNGGFAQPSVVFCAESGGRGGNGGNGGHGGGGGGGCGGVAFGVALVPGPNGFANGYEMSNTFASGGAGDAGQGGGSLGNSGTAGLAGLAANVVTF